MKSILAIFVLLLTVATISAQTHNVTRGGKSSTSNSSSTTIKSSSTTSTKKSNATISSRRSVGNKHQSMAGSSASSSARTYTSSSLSAEKRRIIDNIILNMVYVSGGTFTMGANSEQEEEIEEEVEEKLKELGYFIDHDEIPCHQVTLSSFSIGRHEVTQEEWKAVMGSNPSEFIGAQLPVENVSWNDCQKFIKKLNAITGKTFRLPTEAEWEFAARGGNKSKHYEYSGSNDLDEVAWYYENSGDKKLTFTLDHGSSDEDIDEQIDFGVEANHCKTHQIMKKEPNELGIYDMSGNVSEWCSDWYGVYSRLKQVNPKGASSGSSRVIRGGNLINLTNNCRVSSRGKSAPDNCYSNVGFRLAF